VSRRGSGRGKETHALGICNSGRAGPRNADRRVAGRLPPWIVRRSPDSTSALRVRCGPISCAPRAIRRWPRPHAGSYVRFLCAAHAPSLAAEGEVAARLYLFRIAPTCCATIGAGRVPPPSTKSPKSFSLFPAPKRSPIPVPCLARAQANEGARAATALAGPRRGLFPSRHRGGHGLAAPASGCCSSGRGAKLPSSCACRTRAREGAMTSILQCCEVARARRK